MPLAQCLKVSKYLKCTLSYLLFEMGETEAWILSPEPSQSSPLLSFPLGATCLGCFFSLPPIKTYMSVVSGHQGKQLVLSLCCMDPFSNVQG